MKNRRVLAVTVAALLSLSLVVCQSSLVHAKSSTQPIKTGVEKLTQDWCSVQVQDGADGQELLISATMLMRNPSYQVVLKRSKDMSIPETVTVDASVVQKNFGPITQITVPSSATLVIPYKGGQSKVVIRNRVAGHEQESVSLLIGATNK